MSIPVHQLGWMAGVIDLKGSIVRKNNKKRATPQIVLMVETRHFFVIRELSRMTGTQPELQHEKHLKEFMRRGCIEHCPEQHVHSNISTMPAIARWTVSGVAMAIVLYNLMPFLRSNDKGFEEAMQEAFHNLVMVGQGRPAIASAIQRLTDLGWDIPEAVYPDEMEIADAHNGK